ncbi:hypothetical protein F511_20198 [Dorcoceras hygrometricum]|uniref:Uncharacterized protein n=1 Tax=Dorcoceras hygrometricum TaxID=472368 RepID=A0A2Z7AF01_9LAMI|nr:hypothetical protein F511_20198 [Dorcoceras hygrometricum]
MASSLISSSHHIDFDSVFSMEDASLAPVFESLIITGDGVVVSTIGGTAVEISESVFAATFELPSEGLKDLSDVTKNIVFDARNLFSDSKEQIGVGRTPCFPPPRVLNEKTVHIFVHINEQVGMEKTAVSPHVKKTPKKRAVSKKRPVDSDAEVAPIVKKKRTTKGKPATIGLERKRRLVLDDVDETSESTAEQPAAGTATGVQETSADVPVATQPAVAPVVEDQPADDPDAIIEQILTQLDTAAATKGDDQSTEQAKESIPWFDLPFELARQDAEGLLASDTDEDFISDQPTVPLFLDEGDQPQITKIRLGESISIPGAQERDLFYASLPRISIHDKGKEILVEDEPLRDRVMEDVVQFFHSFYLNKLPDFDGLNALKAKESLMLEWAGTDSLETAVRRRVYILAKYKEMLLRKILESHRKYHVPGQPWTATASKIIDLLSVAHSKSLEDLIAHQKAQGIPIEQPCTSTYLDTSIGSGAVLAQFYSMAKSKCWEELLYIVEIPESSPSIPQQQESTSSSSDSQMLFDSNDFRLDDNTEARTSLLASTVDLSSLLDDLKSSLSQRMDDANSEILSRLHSTERSLQTSLGHQNDYLRSLIQSARQEGQTQDDVQLLRLNELKKAVFAQGVSAETNSLADRSRLVISSTILEAVMPKRGKEVEADLPIHFLEVAADLTNHLLQIKFEIVDMLQVWNSWKRPRKEFVRQTDWKEKEIEREEKGGLAEVEHLRGEEDFD